MSPGPLEAVALFSDEVPPADAVSACALPGGPVVRVVLRKDVSPPPWLADPDQPIDDNERVAASRSAVALLFGCWDTTPPLIRIAGFAEVLTRVLALGGVAALLPQALRAVGRSRMCGPWSPEALVAVFVHCHRVRTPLGVWCHTHGMEQFGLPDLEMEVPIADLTTAEEVLDRAIHRMVALDAPFALGESHALGDECGGASFRVVGAAVRPDHVFGACGSFRLMLQR